MLQKIKRALISVSDKSQLQELASVLTKHNVEIISTGGTAKSLTALGFTTIDVAEITGFPEMMDGRVKTLHPKVHSALLACLDNKEHVKAMEQHAITKIDLVVVNLYPFVETVNSGADAATIIENIDIGGPSMIRSAAKNFEFTTVVTSTKSYGELISEMELHDGAVSLDFRKKQAAQAFALTASYDVSISNWFATHLGELFPAKLLLEADLKEVLRYGENSHQKAALYSTNAKVGVVAAEQLQGKELSYNNINDSDSAYNLVAEFTSPAVVIVKHANPCGVAVGADVFAAFNQALYADPVSAFGGIIAINRTVDGRTAQAISKLFAEVVIAPDYEPEALAIFASKKNLRVLKTGVAESDHHNLLLKSITGGVLVQENDFKIPRESDLRLVTKLSPTPAQIADLLFAAKVCKHVKSNAIVIAQNNFTIGVGAGQMSRVESVNIAVQKARKMVKVDPELNNLVLASDAFFPFPDGVVIAAEAGVKAIIQPGGSIQDKDVINIADELNIAMVFSSIRNFKH